jgi:hypothetical protein
MKDYTGWEIVEDAPTKDYSGWEIVGNDSSVPGGMPQQQSQSGFNPQFGSVLMDALKGAGKSIVNTVTAPARIPGLLGEARGAVSNFSRIPQNALAGLAQGGAGLANIPSNISNYAQEKGFLPQGFAERVPRLNDNDHDYAFDVGLTDVQPGDALVQSLFSMLSGGGLAAAVGGPVAGLVTNALGQGTDPVEAAGNILVPKALGKVVGTAPKVVSAANRGNAAKGLVEAEKASKASAKQQYTSIFSSAEQAGAAKNLKAPKVDIKAIKKGSPDGKFVKSLEEARNNPTLENINQAQSAMGKFIRNNQDKPNLAPTTIKALHEAAKAQQQYKETLYKSFEKAGKPELVNDYIKTNEFYKNEVVPYAKSKPLQEFKRGERTAPGLVKTLAKSDKFKAQLSSKHPEVAFSHAANAFGKFDPVRNTGRAGLDLLAKILKGDKK